MIIKVILCFFLGFQIQSVAQSSSSYSRYGLGDIEYGYSARRLGMGQLGTALPDIHNINSINPAGWFGINRVRVEFGLNYKGMTLTSPIESKYYSETEFSGFAFAFPVSTDYGVTLAAGIVPFSNVSYSVVENYSSPEAGEYKISYTGTGGMSKVFTGTSFKLPFGLSLGAVLDYYFGNLNYKSRAEFLTSGIKPAEYLRTYSPRGIGTTLGLITPDLTPVLGITNLSDIRIGFAANIFSSLQTDTVLTTHREGVIDTIAAAVIQTNIPPRIFTGLSFVLSTNYFIALDYVFQQWENMEFDGNNSEYLRNSYKFSGGFEYRPSRELGSSFWEQIILRWGLSYEQTQYIFNGNGIDYYSVSAGFSLPLNEANTLDFGLLYGIRGKADLIKEKIINLSIGISLGDIWFIRRDK